MVVTEGGNVLLRVKIERELSRTIMSGEYVRIPGRRAIHGSDVDSVSRIRIANGRDAASHQIVRRIARLMHPSNLAAVCRPSVVP